MSGADEAAETGEMSDEYSDDDDPGAHAALAYASLLSKRYSEFCFVGLAPSLLFVERQEI